MGRFTGTGALVLIGLIILGINMYEHPIKNSIPDTPIKIASYNMQIFGITKASNPDLMRQYETLIKNYDIFFVQEIRDESGQAFQALCGDLTDYQCMISSRAGTTSSKEQYGVIYKRTNITEFYDYNLYNWSNTFERPPIRVTFNFTNYTATFFLIHTKPDEARKEIASLEMEVIQQNIPYTVVLGDLNADCNYYNGTAFSMYTSLINSDTTTGNTNCAYDRIYVSPQMYIKIKNSGIDMTTNEQMSDHYPVFFEL